jgi:hypothetical protein
MNVYAWIREGVKQAVLLGFSDAVEQIGVPEGNEQANNHLLSVFRSINATPATATLGASQRPAPLKRRLGRSLDQLAEDSRSERDG